MSGLIKSGGQAGAGGIADYNGAFTQATASSAITQIVAPAANVNGVNVLRMCVSGSVASNGGKAFVHLLAKTSAPANANDGDLISVLAFNEYSKEVGPANADIYIKIPAGKGLYFAATGGYTTDVTTKSLTYKIL